MKALVVSYVDGITESIVEAIRMFDKDSVIDTVKDTSSARHNLRLLGEENTYDIIVIDMMVQEDYGILADPILEPALRFIRLRNRFEKLNFPKKVFALFDSNETGERGKEEVREMGYAVSNYCFYSIQWRRELHEYLAK